jgi:hypothetical protein
MRRFVLEWRKLGLGQRLGARLITYADDLVILCQKGNAEAALDETRRLMGKLKLTVNEDKTRICKVPDERFDFLGYTFGRIYSAKTGRARMGYQPSKKSIKRAVETIHALTERRATWQDVTVLVTKINRTLRGWANYFSVGTTSQAYRAIDSYTVVRLRRWLRRKHGKAGKRAGAYLPQQYGLVRLTQLGRGAVGEGLMLCPRAGCREIRMSGSMSRGWKRVLW